MSMLEAAKIPIVKIAAIAVIIFCIVAVGSMTGLIHSALPLGKKCVDCGVVESVKAVQVSGQGTGLGAVAGGVVGAVVGSRIGAGQGRTLAEVAGAAGGALAGHQIEKNVKKTLRYRITVQMNNGAIRTVTQSTDNGLNAGDRVKIVNGTVVKA
ncbi:MAG TPA: glycine zipper 2TM domain-containing protein [Nitrospiria bacterium]|nr:glycine zipper 2TM domain-containing protein [Nitrospiria bacterium]